MLKDISLNHAQISKNIFAMEDIKFVQKQLIEVFKNKNITK
jgi:hypothetical protein